MSGLVVGAGQRRSSLRSTDSRGRLSPHVSFFTPTWLFMLSNTLGGCGAGRRDISCAARMEIFMW
jgi:hypothetical protein